MHLLCSCTYLLLQKDLSSLFNWSVNNFVSFNLSKFVFMSFHQLFNSSYNVNGHVITELRSWHCFFQYSYLARPLWNDSSKAYRSLGSLHRVFKDYHCAQPRKLLYITLIRSELLYCSTVWRPHLLKEIELLEKYKRRATTFILSNYHSDYKTRLIQTGLLPLMYVYEITDILFFIKSIKHPSDKSDILILLPLLQDLLSQSSTLR